MLITPFCQRTGLTRDAVRLYVKLGLLEPDIGAAASNRYQNFSSHDVERAALVRTAQQLGFTLKQIAALNREYSAGSMDRSRKIAILRDQLQAIDAKAAHIHAMRAYLAAKIAWLEAGAHGAEPTFDDRHR